jgi:DNA-binding response OmpR family regulator
MLVLAVAAERLADALRLAGHTVTVAATTGEAELAARSRRFDVVVTARDAVDLKRRLGSAAIAAVATSDEAAALLADGIDEVVHEGMGEREQVTRIEALASRGGAAPAPAELGPLRVDEASGDATWHGRRLSLTARERAVLHTLARAGGATVRREVIYRAVWGYAMARGDRSVDVNVKRLRDKLGSQVGAPLAIETEPGVGYRLTLSQLRNSTVTEL